jgi:hypothetical protein
LVKRIRKGGDNDNKGPGAGPSKDTSDEHSGGKPSGGDKDIASTEDSDTKQTSTKRGFFGKCKDIAYKIMQSTYHGLQKMQKGVHNMKEEHIKHKAEREVAAAKGQNAVDAVVRKGQLARMKDQKTLVEEAKGISIEDIHATTEKLIMTIAQEQTELLGKLSKKQAELAAKHALEDSQQIHEINQRLLDLEGLQQEAQTLNEEDMDARIKLERMLNKLKVIEAQGESQVNQVRREDRRLGAHSFGERLRATFTGLGHVSKEEIDSAKKSLEKAGIKFAEMQTQEARKVYEAATRRLAEDIRKHKYTEEQMATITQKVIEDFSLQPNNKAM